jgi:hypothetical protein
MQLSGSRIASSHTQGCPRPLPHQRFICRQRSLFCSQASDGTAAPGNTELDLLISKFETVIEKQNSAFSEKLGAVYKEIIERTSKENDERQIALESERSERQLALK